MALALNNLQRVDMQLNKGTNQPTNQPTNQDQYIDKYSILWIKV